MIPSKHRYIFSKIDNNVARLWQSISNSFHYRRRWHKIMGSKTWIQNSYAFYGNYCLNWYIYTIIWTSIILHYIRLVVPWMLINIQKKQYLILFHDIANHILIILKLNYQSFSCRGIAKSKNLRFTFTWISLEEICHRNCGKKLPKKL